MANNRLKYYELTSSFNRELSKESIKATCRQYIGKEYPTTTIDGIYQSYFVLSNSVSYAYNLLYNMIKYAKPKTEIIAIDVYTLLANLKSNMYKKGKQGYDVDGIVIYDVGVSKLSDYDRGLLTHYFLSRVNNNRHIAIVTRTMDVNTIAKSIGSSLWDLFCCELYKIKAVDETASN